MAAKYDNPTGKVDTGWVLLMRDPKSIAFNSNVLILKNDKKYLIVIIDHQKLKEYYKTKKNSKYFEYRKKLIIPDSLILRPLIISCK